MKTANQQPHNSTDGQLQPDKSQKQTLRKQDHKPACGKPEADNTEQAAEHWKPGAGHTEEQLNTANIKHGDKVE